jgi:peptidoglycan lytic transglycosylase A
MLHSIESSLLTEMRLLPLCLAALLALAGCQSAPPAPGSGRGEISPPGPKPKPTGPGAAGVLRQSSWDALPGWREDDPSRAWPAFQASCQVLARQESWRAICSAAAELALPDRETARRFFETNLTPFQASTADGNDEGLITGYYEPLLRGSRTRTERFRYPVYGLPDDLLVVDLSAVYPQLKGLRLRGRLDGRRVIPYYDREAIEEGLAPLEGKQIAWVDDAIELFFLQIQGSGRIALEDGEVLRVGYADQNGHPYRSIGRLLVERGELPLEKASMQGIQAWARAHPEKLDELLNYNASYVFFRELPPGLPGPLGALGVPLTPRRSVAVDPALIPLGVPVYIATTWPLSDKPLNRLMIAQDTGGAIRGPVRADFFWGFGPDAAREAGRMRQSLRLWVLVPISPPDARP